MSRRPKEQTYFDLAEAWSKQSTCHRMQAACVIVSDDGHVLASGYNGAPRNLPHCDPLSCIPGGPVRCTVTVHDAANAVAQAARLGISLRGGAYYGTHRPCIQCTYLLIQVGISAIYYHTDYHSDSVDEVKQACAYARIPISQLRRIPSG